MILPCAIYIRKLVARGGKDDHLHLQSWCLIFNASNFQQHIGRHARNRIYFESLGLDISKPMHGFRDQLRKL
jgi:hypothetical protein